MITEHLEDTLVLHGDAMDEHLLADEGASRSEMVVAALGDETDNMFVALLAKRLGALRVAALLNTPGHTALASGSNGAGPWGKWGLSTPTSTYIPPAESCSASSCSSAGSS
jgi:voltage-gated potassium channel Kch